MKRLIALLIALLFVAGLILGFGAGFLYPDKGTVGYREVTMTLPAVKASGDGMTASLTTIVKPGSGLVLVSVNDVLAGLETQLSARTASQVASNITHISLDDLDVIYLIDANASSIEGPSAGAAFTVSTIAALNGQEINKSIMMTGSIRENGEIGPASGIPEKIRAGAQLGAKLFLVPKGQLVSEGLRKEEACDVSDGVKYCSITYSSNASTFSIPVKEVSSVEEAWRFFV